MSEIVKQIRERLANNGRNPANNNAGIRVGSDLHLCEMLLKELDAANAEVSRLTTLAQEGRKAGLEEAIEYCQGEITRLKVQISDNEAYLKRTGSQGSGANDICRRAVTEHEFAIRHFRALIPQKQGEKGK